MFEFLEPFDKIIVTGPQRSGTRICGKMIAHSLSKTFFHESEVKIHSPHLLNQILKTKSNFVIQCPGLCRYIHQFGTIDDLAICVMIRDIDDIIASQERIKWHSERFELQKYKSVNGPIATIKYAFWHSHQKKIIKHPFEIPYKWLADHPLWISKKQRKNFTPGQTDLENSDNK